MLPPGPTSKLLTTRRILQDPFTWLPRWRAQYGDPYRLPAMNGTVTMTGDPDLVKAIFSAPPASYEPWATRAVESFTGPGSMLVLRDERHRQERKLLAPPFHGHKMRSLGKVMAETAARHGQAASRAGFVNMLELAQAISLEIIIRAVFGVQEPKRVAQFVDAIGRFTAAAHPMLLFFTPLHTPLFPPWTRYERAFAAFDALLQSQIEAARAKGADDEDILTMMLQAHYEDGQPMADGDIRDELRTLLLAGHETTAITLAWAMDRLHRTPGALADVLDTIDGATDSAEFYVKDPLLEGVWKETLRVHPPVTEALRELNTPMDLGRYHVPAGEAVAACILHVHQNPDLYPRPEQFAPRRFVDRRYGPTEFFPFGGGHRRCLGAAFAAHELEIVLAVLLRHHHFSLVEDEPPTPIRRNVTLGPKGGVPLRVRPRMRPRSRLAS